MQSRRSNAKRRSDLPLAAPRRMETMVQGWGNPSALAAANGPSYDSCPNTLLLSRRHGRIVVARKRHDLTLTNQHRHAHASSRCCRLAKGLYKRKLYRTFNATLPPAPNTAPVLLGVDARLQRDVKHAYRARNVASQLNPICVGGTQLPQGFGAEDVHIKRACTGPTVVTAQNNDDCVPSRHCAIVEGREAERT
ncbi:hypothetical protein WOLCODRAFT_154418 [Wolfiporia cocos MD-104 SS10]|uniref:Uncharacterized protein n=1 Tax=Wolfiporia cocos (strain MD-104) TaxID=742152 RepID=A0A2H3JR21_WOLCO|nr:hypothetical protein WOLCODRAFT_154418 [Wolfiporia cocos MD-104 SS10]